MARNSATLVKVCLSALLLNAALMAFGGNDLQPRPVAAGNAPMANQNWHELSLPAGTAIRMKLDKPLSSIRNKPGDSFSGTITQEIRLNGRIVIPAGAMLSGKITRVSSPRRIKGKPSLALRPEQITLPDEMRLPVSAVVVDTSSPRRLDVDDEGHIRGRGRDSSDNLEAVVTTGAGAGVGAVVGGGAGALIGAGTGATVSTVHWLARHRSVEIPAGTELVLELQRPLSLSAERRN